MALVAHPRLRLVSAVVMPTEVGTQTSIINFV
jgi:hypothetical protein